MVKKILALGSAFCLFITQSVYAVCPLCTIAVGAGIGFSEWLGIDDTITGLWVGGFLMSLVVWTVDWLNRKQIKFKGRKILITFLYYVVTLMPLYHLGIMGRPDNDLWGIDKLLLGIIIGSICFLFGAVYYLHLKKQRGGHAYFPFQKVVMPVAPLLVLTIAFYFITR
jgi:TM2 domain-containing membrane protein YozV